MRRQARHALRRTRGPHSTHATPRAVPARRLTRRVRRPDASCPGRWRHRAFACRTHADRSGDGRYSCVEALVRLRVRKRSRPHRLTRPSYQQPRTAARAAGRQKQSGRSCDRPDCSGTGAPGRIRTHDPLVRSQVLYPTELRARGRELYMTRRRESTANDARRNGEQKDGGGEPLLPLLPDREPRWQGGGPRIHSCKAFIAYSWPKL